MHEISRGALAGFIATIIFGLIMLVMLPKTLNKIAALYGANGQMIGFLIHLLHGSIIGGLFGSFMSTHISTPKASWYGLLYGLVWWVLGPILIMPTWLGAGPRLSSAGIKAALPSLPGHLIYGVILGLLFAVFTVSSRSQGTPHQTKQ